jgi:hypothetical protein
MNELYRMIILLSGLLIVIITIAIFLQQKKFGRVPDGARLDLISASPNYKNGSFQNLNPTPALAEGVSYFIVLKEFFIDRKERIKPTDPIPSIKTDLFSLDINDDILIWFGHSSYYMQADGKRILVDPVFSGSASPLPFGTKAFKGTDIYTVDDMPPIDYLFITHDHWDHLDYTTILALKSKIKTVICSLGTSAHLVYWGYEKKIIREED